MQKFEEQQPAYTYATCVAVSAQHNETMLSTMKVEDGRGGWLRVTSF